MLAHFIALRNKIFFSIRYPIEKLISKYSLVENKIFYNTADFSWVGDIESQWHLIRNELDEVLKDRKSIPNVQDISVEQLRLTKDDGWKTFWFYLYGRRMDTNCKRCPHTVRLLEQIPGMSTAFFSIFMPGKHLPEHRGPFKGVLRYHLALIVPEPASACGIKVGGQTAQWEEGKSLIFDDSYAHEAWNLSQGMRVVLFVDFRRPVAFPVSLLNDAMFYLISRSVFTNRALKRQKLWDQNLIH